MRRTYGLAVLAIAGALLTGCGASPVGGAVKDVAHAGASSDHSQTPSLVSQPESTPNLASASSTAADGAGGCDTTSPKATAAFRKTFRVTPGRCFDRADPRVSQDPEGPKAVKALFRDFCSKIGMEDRIASQTGHGYYWATTLGYIIDSDDEGGSCTWGLQYLGSGTAGAASKRALIVEYERVSTDPGEAWVAAQNEYGSRGAKYLKQVTGVGVLANLWSAGQDGAGNEYKSLLASDAHGTIVLVTANSHGLSKMLDEVARRALEAAAQLD